MNSLKKISLLGLILAIFSFSSCEKDPGYDTNYLLVPFILENVKFHGQEYKKDDEAFRLSEERSEVNQKIVFIEKEQIAEGAINDMSFSILIPIDPKRYDMEFSNKTATVTSTEDAWEQSLSLEKVEEFTENLITYHRYKAKINSFDQEIDVDNFKYLSLRLQGTYQEIKGKKKEEPRTIMVTLYTKS